MAKNFSPERRKLRLVKIDKGKKLGEQGAKVKWMQYYIVPAGYMCTEQYTLSWMFFIQGEFDVRHKNYCRVSPMINNAYNKENTVNLMMYVIEGERVYSKLSASSPSYCRPGSEYFSIL